MFYPGKIMDLSDGNASIIVGRSDMQDSIISKARETSSIFPRHNFIENDQDGLFSLHDLHLENRDRVFKIIN